MRAGWLAGGQKIGLESACVCGETRMVRARRWRGRNGVTWRKGVREAVDVVLGLRKG
jgi:hypothetical protein